ncbi:MAG: Hcp family type VI secretion system effector [Succinivibrio sp.]
MASDFFVKVDGIDGESNDNSHKKWIEVIKFSHGSIQQIAAGRSTDVSGRGHFEPFTFVHLVDKATPKLQQFCMSGQKIAKVEFVVCRAVAGAQVPVYEVTLENVKIASAKVSTLLADESQSFRERVELPVEEISLIAGKATWKATAIKPDNTKDGAVEASYNQVENG